MSSILSSQNVVFATAMAVSGTVLILAIRLQKSVSFLSSDDAGDRGKTEKRRKKRVHFAEDVVDPIGNSDEYRKLRRKAKAIIIIEDEQQDSTDSSSLRKLGGDQMPANRVALYNGILRDRGCQRMTYAK